MQHNTQHPAIGLMCRGITRPTTRSSTSELLPRCITSCGLRAPPPPYLSAQGGDVPLEGGVHPVEGLGFAEVLAHVVGKLLQLLLDLSHQLLPVVKVPGSEREGEQTGSGSVS